MKIQRAFELESGWEVHGKEFIYNQQISNFRGQQIDDIF
jgi:hypothetical protein